MQNTNDEDPKTSAELTAKMLLLQHKIKIDLKNYNKILKKPGMQKKKFKW